MLAALGRGKTLVRTLSFGFDVDCSARGTAAVVDGARVLLTPLRLVVLPPPLASVAVTLPAPAACVALRDAGGAEVSRPEHVYDCCTRDVGMHGDASCDMAWCPVNKLLTALNALVEAVVGCQLSILRPGLDVAQMWQQAGANKQWRWLVFITCCQALARRLVKQEAHADPGIP